MNKFILALDNSNYKDEFKKRVIKYIDRDKVFGIIISKDMIDDIYDFKVFVKIDFLDDLSYLKEKGVYGCKIRSLIVNDDVDTIRDTVYQLFNCARRVYSHGLIPIIEPEVSIGAKNKKRCEEILKEEIKKYLSVDIKFILKLTLPEVDDFYGDFLDSDSLICLSFLSGGYGKDKATYKLSKNRGIACFSRAALEGLNNFQSDDEFKNILSKNINDIYLASN